MKALTFDICLLAPCLFTIPAGGDPSTEESRTYIPGSAVRGALVGLYTGTKHAADAQFRRLFLDGTVRVLNAYPLDKQGRRTLPTPLSWQRRKDPPSLVEGQPGEPADSASEITDFALPTAKPGTDIWKGVDAPYCTVTTKVQLVEPEFEVNLHNGREDRQRPTADGATLFQYTALAAAQRFGAAIVVADKNEALLDRLAGLLNAGTRLRMGRSQRAGYGLVEIQNVRRHPEHSDATPASSASGWFEQGAEPAELEGDGIVIVTLLSDTIVRDANGADAASLDAVVGVPYGDAYVKIGVVGGFNRTWNLPLPQAQAILAGSVFTYPASAQEAKGWRELMDKGVGERTAEGFGRIALNWQQELPTGSAGGQPHKQQTNEPDGSTGALADPSALPEADAAALRALAHRLLRTKMDAALIAAVGRLELQRGRAQNAQLSRLRTVVQRSLAGTAFADAVAENKLALLERHLKNLRQTGREQLISARVGSARFYDWLRNLAATPSGVWEVLGNQSTLELGGIVVEPTSEETIEYCLRLIDGVTRLALKKEAA